MAVNVIRCEKQRARYLEEAPAPHGGHICALAPVEPARVAAPPARLPCIAYLRRDLLGILKKSRKAKFLLVSPKVWKH